MASKTVETRKIKYGRLWPNKPWGKNGALIQCPDWYIELVCLREYHHQRSLKHTRLVSWAQHFVNFTTEVFGDPAYLNSGQWFYFEWNPNAKRILENFCRHKILSVAGHASSSKSESLALIGAMMFFLFPFDTKVLVTSTTGGAAKQKIWGKIKQIWNHLEKWMPQGTVPGKVIDSQNLIRFELNGDKNELTGIALVPSEKSQAKESEAKIQGTKAKRMILIGDEFATLQPSLVNTALTNLAVNEGFRMMGAFNPDSYYDAGGIISRPKDGWHSITEETDEWETEIEPYGIKGYCIRFDGEKSPNVLAGEKKWKGLLSREMLDQFAASGTKTKEYYKMVRGYWSPTGGRDCIYSEAEIIRWGADRPVTTWVEPPVMIAGLDPAFTHGGDRAVLCIGKSGIAQNVDTSKVQRVIELTHIYVLDEDVTNKTISKVEWVVKLTKEKLAHHKVDVRNLAIDATGGGEPFGALIARDIGMGFLNVCFSGKASDMPVSRNDSRKGHERFRNMASELWYVGKELIRTGQLKGIKPDMVTEMVARTYEEKGGVVQIESKKEMKLRTKKSPDISDAGFLALHLARVRHGVSSNEKAAVVVRPKNGIQPDFSFLTKKAFQSSIPQGRLVDTGGGWGYG